MAEFSSSDISNLSTLLPMPKNALPLVIIGAGGIVSDAHLPAYKKAGFEVIGIFDPVKEKAEKCAKDFNIKKLYASEEEALLEKNVVFDIAVPPQVLLEVVKKIPANSICQLQKPMGNSMHDAAEIKKIIKEKNIIACVNLQLKFSPMMIALREAISKGMIGDITELEISLSVKTPWHLWPFLETLDNVEVPLHSIHYLDWIRSVLGNPNSVHCKSIKHPSVPKLSDAYDNATNIFTLCPTESWCQVPEEEVAGASQRSEYSKVLEPIYDWNIFKRYLSDKRNFFSACPSSRSTPSGM